MKIKIGRTCVNIYVVRYGKDGGIIVPRREAKRIADYFKSLKERQAKRGTE